MSEMVVQKQLDYYNAHDLEGFLSCYHEDAVIYRLKDQSVIMNGIDELRRRYGIRLQKAKPHAHINKRIVLGNQVIDEESVTGLDIEGTKRVGAIYDVEGDKIRRVWFVYE